MPHEPWRDMSVESVVELVNTVTDLLISRLDLGAERYESTTKGFQGDPEQHLIEDALDTIVYAMVTRRKIKGLEARIRELENV